MQIQSLSKFLEKQQTVPECELQVSIEEISSGH